ncbi:S8 family peptidase [Streptomyces sp. NRRL B-1140]|uniref:S8 family peptidase n=1 Tax=Streptomyces sp. NRRL B-1140 TaxID=1415549 RepID=UPI001F201CA0|nr:S8 family serine peptidase [Streptomyces sp. NRRL B-1140]
MERTPGRSNIAVGLIDGRVARDHPDLRGHPVRELHPAQQGGCGADDPCCAHGTFVAGILSARRGSAAPGICPHCTLLSRPVFSSRPATSAGAPEYGCLSGARAEELAAAIVETVDAGARVLNLSLAQAEPSSGRHRVLDEALDHAANKGVIVVVAAGNHGTLGTSVITRHPWTIPVIACDGDGRPLSLSNLGAEIGRRGLSAPGKDVTSLGSAGKPLRITGTSAAAPFVTGAIALLLSQFPAARPAVVRFAVTRSAAGRHRRGSVAPPLLNAWAAYNALCRDTG